jgi:hypothetical protein
LPGALLQRWQSGNLRSYAAWLAAGAAAVLLFLLVPWPTVLAGFVAIHLEDGGALENDAINNRFSPDPAASAGRSGAGGAAARPRKLPNWIALLTTLATFGLTLHLPAHFIRRSGRLPI